MNQRILLKIAIHLGVLLFICSLAWLFLFISGNFTTLHPNAYRDLTTSILFVYGIILVLRFGYYVISKLVSKQLTVSQVFDRFALWWKSLTPIEVLGGSFTLVTLVNSVMMITGVDTPKEGTFAYIHMMTRFVIITLIVGIWMLKDLLLYIKTYSFKHRMTQFIVQAPTRTLSSVAVSFTVLTVLYCLIMIALQTVINPEGGYDFYVVLLVMLAFLMLVFIVIRVIKKKKKSDEQDVVTSPSRSE